MWLGLWEVCCTVTGYFFHSLSSDSQHFLMFYRMSSTVHHSIGSTTRGIYIAFRVLNWNLRATFLRHYWEIDLSTRDLEVKNGRQNVRSSMSYFMSYLSPVQGISPSNGCWTEEMPSTQGHLDNIMRVYTEFARGIYLVKPSVLSQPKGRCADAVLQRYWKK